MKKICFLASGGGHLEQINQLKQLKEKYDYFYVVQKTETNKKMKEKHYFISENTKHNNVQFALKSILIFFQSIKIFWKEKPDVIICTGAGATIPMCYVGKMFRKKIIFIESFAKMNSPTETGKMVYPIADLFIVQWEEMKKFYPKAVCGGWIY